MVELLKLSSKGQVVIPKSIRDRLNLREGDRLVAFAKKNLLVLRKIESEESVVSILSHRVREKVLKPGIREEDANEAVRWARRSI